MSRTFSLARMLLYVTLVAVACGFLVNFPDATRSILIGACLAAPMLFLWLGLNHKYRIFTAKLTASFAGGLAGIYFMRILIETKRLNLDFNTWSLAGWLTIAAISIASTFLPLGAIVLGEHCWRRYRQ